MRSVAGTVAPVLIVSLRALARSFDGTLRLTKSGASPTTLTLTRARPVRPCASRASSVSRCVPAASPATEIALPCPST
jgi:hypothetical protein